MSAYTLRQYQRDAVDALWSYLGSGKGRAPLLVLPTGAGKSLVLAQVCREWMLADPGVQILVATHVKELVEQNGEKLAAMIGAGAVGVHSAGLGRRDTDQRVIVGGVQSLVRRIDELGPRHVVIVDEAHRIPRDGDGQYQRLLDGVKAQVLVGLTATPGRMDSGMLHEGDGAMFDGVAYEIGMAELVKAGYLSKLRPYGSDVQIDLTHAQIRNGDFDLDAMAEQLEDVEILRRGLDEWEKHDTSRTLIFCATVRQAELVLDDLVRRKVDAELITGKTSASDRARWIADYKAGKLRVLVNVMVLTTGFDAPETDCIVCFRPMASTGLYVQVMGRGSRIAEGKKDCLVLDCARNVERHGPVTHPRWQTKKSGADPVASEGGVMAKRCKACGTMNAIAAIECDECGEPFPKKITPKPSSLELMDLGEPVQLAVLSTSVMPHVSKAGNECVRLDHWARAVPQEEWLCYSEWYTVAGYGRTKLERRMGQALYGDSLDGLVSEVRSELNARPIGWITVRREGRYPEVTAWDFDLESRDAHEVPFLGADECPF